MKTIVRTFALAVMMLTVSCAMAFAQQTKPQRISKEQRLSREQLAEVQARHIASELAFSTAVTDRFVKTYCACQKEIWALGPRQRPGKRELTEQENEQRIKERFVMSEKILNVRQKYYKEYSEFLTQAQIEKVYEQERKIMKRFSERGHNRTNTKRVGTR